MVERTPEAEIERLRADNTALRNELAAAEQHKQNVRQAQAEVLKTGGSLLLPLFDRQKVVKNGLGLFDVASGFVKGREQWPNQEQLLVQGREFVLSLLQFSIRRRLFMLMISLLAFLVPLVQVWLVFQQNAIIENQDKYFNIQVYDIVARSLTGDNSTAKQISAALLAREDFELVNGIISAVFESETGGAFTEEDVARGRTVFLEETAARGHLISALVLGLDRHAKTMSSDDLWTQARPTFDLVAKDAATRLPQLLRMSRKSASDNPAVEQECFRYLFALSTLMRRADSLARAEDDSEAFFKSVAPAVSRLSRSPSTGGAFDTVFEAAMQEWLLDLGLQPEFGEEADDVAGQQMGPLLKQGLQRLVEGSKPHAPRLNANGIARRFGVSP